VNDYENESVCEQSKSRDIVREVSFTSFKRLTTSLKTPYLKPIVAVCRACLILLLDFPHLLTGKHRAQKRIVLKARH